MVLMPQELSLVTDQVLLEANLLETIIVLLEPYYLKQSLSSWKPINGVSSCPARTLLLEAVLDLQEPSHWRWSFSCSDHMTSYNHASKMTPFQHLQNAENQTKRTGTLMGPWGTAVPSFVLWHFRKAMHHTIVYTSIKQKFLTKPLRTADPTLPKEHFLIRDEHS